MVLPGGPYVLSGPVSVTDYLGCAVDHGDVLALCRCGSSGTKPTCDGACVTDGFDDAKKAERQPDRRDSYVGLSVTVYDNRGICQHSGLCTDRLPSVFHAGGEPFVTSSGGRMDEIVRAARDCPSGALSVAIDDAEARSVVDWGRQRPPTVLVTRDGPYRLTGSVEIVDPGGEAISRAEGSSSEHAALCRCGHSQNKPFCSGMHWYVDFHDPVPAAEPTIFEWVGGLPALVRMTRVFYERYVPDDDLLAPLFASMSADHPERVAAWLAEVFGGPQAYSGPYGGYPHMLAEHAGKRITEAARARWVQLLTRAAGDAGLPNDAEFRSAFGSYIEWGSRLAFENSQTDARPPQRMPMPRWDWQTAAGPPGSRVSALAPMEPVAVASVVLPADGEPVSFERHIKTLFRERDRRSMRFAFDLWDHGDVVTHGRAVLARLRDGTMPCDGSWPPEHVEVFARWLDEGGTT